MKVTPSPTLTEPLHNMGAMCSSHDRLSDRHALQLSTVKSTICPTATHNLWPAATRDLLRTRCMRCRLSVCLTGSLTEKLCILQTARRLISRCLDRPSSAASAAGSNLMWVVNSSSVAAEYRTILGPVDDHAPECALHLSVWPTLPWIQGRYSVSLPSRTVSII